MLSIKLHSTIVSLILLHQPLRPFDHQKINHKSSHNCPTAPALQTIQWAGKSRRKEGGNRASRARAEQPNMHWQLKELAPHTHTHTALSPPLYTELHWHLQIAKRGCAYHYFQLGDGNGDVGDADRDGDVDAAALLHFATIRKLRIRQVSSERECERRGEAAAHTMIYFSFVEFWLCVEPPLASCLSLLLLSPTERRQYLNICKRQRKRGREEVGEGRERER